MQTAVMQATAMLARWWSEVALEATHLAVGKEKYPCVVVCFKGSIEKLIMILPYAVSQWVVIASETKMECGSGILNTVVVLRPLLYIGST